MEVTAKHRPEVALPAQLAEPKHAKQTSQKPQKAAATPRTRTPEG